MATKNGPKKAVTKSPYKKIKPGELTVGNLYTSDTPEGKRAREIYGEPVGVKLQKLKDKMFKKK